MGTSGKQSTTLAWRQLNHGAHFAAGSGWGAAPRDLVIEVADELVLAGATGLAYDRMTTS